MFETIKFPYSKGSAYLGVGLPIIFFLITFSNLRQAIITGNIISWAIISFADIVFACLLFFVLFKRLIPALKGKVALEFNNDGIVDHIRNIIIEWKDVRDINLLAGRNYATLTIDLKHNTEYGTQIGISLRWVKGKDMETYQTAVAYLEEVNGLV